MACGGEGELFYLIVFEQSLWCMDLVMCIDKITYLLMLYEVNVSSIDDTLHAINSLGTIDCLAQQAGLTWARGASSSDRWQVGDLGSCTMFGTAV